MMIFTKLNIKMKTILLIVFALAASLQFTAAQTKILKNSVIEIAVMGVPPGEQARINAEYPVDSNGNIRMWGIGSVSAAGLSSTALSQKIESAYKAVQIYTSPTILVRTNSGTERITEQVTLAGSVNRPGPIAWANGMTLAQALAAAGGPTTFGTTKRVTIYREGKKYALSPLTNDQHKLEKIYPSDTIEVDQVKAWEQGGR